MAVNTDVYGAKSDWLDFITGSSIKLARFSESSEIDSNRVREGFVNGKFVANEPYDSSVVHSGLGSESALAHLKTVRGGTVLTEDNYEVVPYSFVTGSSGYFSSSDSNINNHNILTPLTNPSITTRAFNIITDFDYKKIRVLIIVRCGRTNQTSDAVFTLSEYLTHADEYPYITAVRLALYEKIGELYSPCSFLSYKGFLLHADSKYTTNFRKDRDSEYFKEGRIGTFLGANYGSGANNNTINIFGLLNQRLGDNRVYTTDYDLVSGDCEVVLDGDGRGYYYKTYDSDFEEWCMKQVACFGLQFVTDEEYLQVNLETEQDERVAANVCMGVLDNDFIGHGEYVRGKAVLSQPQYKLDSADKSPYVPGRLDPSKDSGDHISQYHIIDTLIKGSRVYGITGDNLESLLLEIANLQEGEVEQNYADFITSVTFCPWGFDRVTEGATIKIFGREFETRGREIGRVLRHNSETVYIKRQYNDFRDYAPYTKITIKIPFADTVELDPSEWYGCGIKLLYYVDVCTGVGEVSVQRISDLGALEFMRLACNLATPITLNAVMSGSYLNAQHNARTRMNRALLNSALSGSISAARGDSGGVITSVASGIFEGVEGHYEITHMPKPTKQVGSIGAMSDFSFDWRAAITYERVQIDPQFDKEKYANSIGYACCKTTTIDSERGMVVCSDVKVDNCTLTSTEKDMIVSQAKRGIIV